MFTGSETKSLFLDFETLLSSKYQYKKREKKASETEREGFRGIVAEQSAGTVSPGLQVPAASMPPAPAVASRGARNLSGASVLTAPHRARGTRQAGQGVEGPGVSPVNTASAGNRR